MAQPIGKILQEVLRREKWDQKINQIRIEEHWEKIMGKTIAKYTYNVFLQHGVLFINTDLAPLKHELEFSKAQIIGNINSYFKQDIVKKVVIK
ncbi:MAG TPA: DUF721 domain-containing protein [Chitinophagaceae bacterium]|nr:DUF721 domain-containing protein [Chitinophagaceae bacterium]